MSAQYKAHRNPVDQQGRLERGRTASAPYNFIPVPEAVADVTKDEHGANVSLPDQSRYGKGLKSGYFKLKLTTLSPLYIRGPITAEEEKRAQEAKESPKTSAFFYIDKEDTPVIPGSSIRGVLRNMLSIIGYGKMERVSDQPLYFRERGSKSYINRFGNFSVQEVKAKPGFIVKKGGQYFIAPCSKMMARVHPKAFKSHPERRPFYRSLFEGKAPNAYPRWPKKPGDWGQYCKVWIQHRSRKGFPYVDTIANRPVSNWEEGRLVLTGNTQVKGEHRNTTFHFVFFAPNRNENDWIPIDDTLLEQFHRDQLTELQEKAFPVNQPEKNCREQDGWIRKQPGKTEEDWGDPVFYLTEESDDRKLFFFGRALYFRIPFPYTPNDLVPPHARPLSDNRKDKNATESTDYAEALFGYADRPKHDKKQASYKSRVSITAAKLTSDFRGGNVLMEEMNPRILLGPKPTSYQHYITQPGRTTSRKALLTYDDESKEKGARVRGHKLYWHQMPAASDEASWRAHIQETDPEKLKNKKVQTQLKAVKPGISFECKVHFENLTARELGALCWAIRPNGGGDKTYAHKLGMGKPLGMGSLQLSAELHLIDTQQRYGQLFEGNSWCEGTESIVDLDSRDLDTFDPITAFERHLVDDVLNAGWEESQQSAGSGAMAEALMAALGTQAPADDRPRLRDMRRVALLLKMLERPGQLPQEDKGLLVSTDGDTAYDPQPNVRYMTLEEFKKRPILPDPSCYGGEMPSPLARPNRKPR